MTDYYSLFEHCIKITREQHVKRERYYRNKQSRIKKELFNRIIQDATEKIKENLYEGFDYAVIYDGEYNKLINELMDSLVYHFKPFNVIYKKKTDNQRGFLEVLQDETNYIIIVDWKHKTQTVSTSPSVKNDIIYTNISELPSKKFTETSTNTDTLLTNTVDDNDDNDVNNTTNGATNNATNDTDTDTDDEKIDTYEKNTNTKYEPENTIEDVRELEEKIFNNNSPKSPDSDDNIINKFGFETIF